MPQKNNNNELLTGIAYWSVPTNSVIIRVLEQTPSNNLILKDYQLPNQSQQPVLDFMKTPYSTDVITDNDYMNDFLTDSFDGVMTHRYIFLGDNFIQPNFKIINYTDSVNTLRQYFDQQVKHP